MNPFEPGDVVECIHSTADLSLIQGGRYIVHDSQPRGIIVRAEGGYPIRDSVTDDIYWHTPRFTLVKRHNAATELQDRIKAMAASNLTCRQMLARFFPELVSIPLTRQDIHGGEYFVCLNGDDCYMPESDVYKAVDRSLDAMNIRGCLVNIAADTAVQRVTSYEDRTPT